MAKMNIDFTALRSQFEGLQGRHPGLWPVLPKAITLGCAFAALLVAAWLVYWQGLNEELEAGRQRETELKDLYRDKMKQAINLDVLREQKKLVLQYVSQLEKQLPSKAEMDALLSDINQAGVGRGLQFELFRPGQVLVKEYYAELPINIRLAGSYHELGAFASDIANMPRIVTLNNIAIANQRQPNSEKVAEGRLVLEAVAKTYRYLDPEEIAEQKRLAAKAKKGAKK